MMHTCDQCGLMSNREIRPDHMVTVECQELAALRAQLAEAQSTNARLREAYDTDTQRLKADIRTLNEHLAGNVWHWSATEDNHVESLVCPILISAEDMRAQLAEAQAREPSKSQIKRISAMAESAEIKRLKAEVGRLREACMEVIAMVDSSPPATEPIAERLITQIRNDMRAALQGEG